MERLEWEALEYEERERGQDWYWALGVIVVTGSLTAVIFKNYFFAGLIMISGILLFFFAQKKPDLISYELDERGLRVRNRLYPYENIKSFFIQESGASVPGSRPTLFIKSERVFMPIISVPINNEYGEYIASVFLDRDIPEEEMREHVSEKIMESLGF